MGSDDLKHLMYSEWVMADYTSLLKKSVMPIFVKRYPLKMREIRVLTNIVQAEDNPTLKDVSEYLREDPATITRSVIILTGNNYIISETDSHDGRSRRLVATEKGEQATKHFIFIFEQVLELASETLNKKLKNLNHYELEKSLKIIAHRAEIISGKSPLNYKTRDTS